MRLYWKNRKNFVHQTCFCFLSAGRRLSQLTMAFLRLEATGNGFFELTWWRVRKNWDASWNVIWTYMNYIVHSWEIESHLGYLETSTNFSTQWSLSSRWACHDAGHAMMPRHARCLYGSPPFHANEEPDEEPVRISSPSGDRRTRIVVRGCPWTSQPRLITGGVYRIWR